MLGKLVAMEERHREGLRDVEKVTRRIERDELFNVVVETSVTKKPDLKRIQEELGKPLGLQLHKKTPKERYMVSCFSSSLVYWMEWNFVPGFLRGHHYQCAKRMGRDT